MSQILWNPFLKSDIGFPESMDELFPDIGLDVRVALFSVPEGFYQFMEEN